MKIWLHFTELLEKYKSEDNQMEVADVQLSNSTAQKFFILLKMSDF